MHLYIFLFLWCLVGIESACFRGQVGKLPDGCKVGNLTVIMYPSYEMIGRTRCNFTVSDSFFNNYPQYINFQYRYGSYAPSYLITAFDRTSKNLLWMVSNLTLTPNLGLIPTSNGQYAKELMPFHRPSTSQVKPYHEVEFLVLEEYRNHPSNMYYNIPNSLYTVPFNLSTWIESQRNSGITLCGPVGGGSAVAYQAPPPPPGPATTQPPYRPPPPYNPSNQNRHKNNSNRNLVDGILLIGLLFSLLRVENRISFLFI